MALDAANSTMTEIGQYEILAKIAEGGMGTVFKARRRDDGMIVAIKIIPPTAARNPVLVQRFKREFNAARQLDHPNVVKAIEFCEGPPSPYLVMEYVEGESLGQKIERDGKISEDAAVRIMAQVCQGLHRAHKQNMVHRDVKPDNVLLTADGVAKLTDLGLVKDIEGEMNLTRTGRGLGTPHFMAPEQFRNAKNADVRCDIYSLGATLYMMVTGKMPFDGCGPLDAWMKKTNSEFPAPRELAPELSERIDWAIRRSMSASPESRPATCREFIEDVIGQSTRPSQAAAHGQAADLWYMVYRDDEGTTHTVKGTTENIRKAFRERLLGDAGNIRACRTKQGPFHALQTYPEFRDLIIEPESLVSSEPGAASPRPTATASSTQTPSPGHDNPTDFGGTAPYQAAGPGSGRWGPGSNSRFPSPSMQRLPATGTETNSPGASSRSIPMREMARSNTATWVMWVAVLAMAIVAGVASVLLLNK
jgi:eukaryotic-like serine/threonine-protein kinase